VQSWFRSTGAEFWMADRSEFNRPEQPRGFFAGKSTRIT